MQERMEALGHNLPEDVKRRIFRFDQHPLATLIKELEFTRYPCRMGVDTVLTIYGPDRCFKRLRPNRLDYTEWMYVRLWRTIDPDWTPRSDTHEPI